jgi:hypothetical protein
MNQNSINIKLINIKQVGFTRKVLFSFTFQVKTFPFLGKMFSVGVYSTFRKHCPVKVGFRFIHVFISTQNIVKYIYLGLTSKQQFFVPY